MSDGSETQGTRGHERPDTALAREPNAPRQSLYTRALFFLLMGSGAFLGATLLLGHLIVSETKARILDERVSTARTAGVFLEDRIKSDLSRLSGVAADLLASVESGALLASSIDRTWARSVDGSLFAGGALVLEDETPILGQGIRSLSDIPADDLGRMIDLASRRNGLVVSGVLTSSRAKALVAVAPIHRSRDATNSTSTSTSASTSASAPASASAPRPAFRPGSRLMLIGLPERGISEILGKIDRPAAKGAALHLVDARGTVVACSDREHLQHEGDHEGTLARAIRDRREFRGECHSCHEEGGETARETEVLAFAPLPTLPLGLKVSQREADALAPARALRNQLVVLGGALILLFIVFSLLAVHSIVRPVVLLTAEVRRAERDRVPLGTGRMADDEVGELASALELWRQRTLDAMAAIDMHRRALREESEAIRRHLEALQAISDLSTAQPGMDALLLSGLDHSLALSKCTSGAMKLERSGRSFEARRGMSPEESTALFRDLSVGIVGRSANVGLIPFDATDKKSSPSVMGCEVEPAEGVRAALVVRRDEAAPPSAPVWIGSLLRHVSMCSSHLLLHDAIEDRRQQQGLFLRRVLEAQEDERRRVARELHDTVAQDLAALRLEVERLSSKEMDADLRLQLVALEGRSKEMLDTVRGILSDLRLSMLESMGLVAALRWLLEKTEQDSGLRTHFMLDGPEFVRLAYHSSLVLFRILQESLQNVVQHAGADHVFVTLNVKDDSIDLLVEDDGMGFVPGDASLRRAPGDRSGFGLVGMAERARSVGGALELVSSPGEGTTVRVTIPRTTESQDLGQKEEGSE